MCYVKRGTNKKYFEAFFTSALSPAIAQNKRTIVFPYITILMLINGSKQNNFSQKNVLIKETCLNDRKRKVLHKKEKTYSQNL